EELDSSEFVRATNEAPAADRRVVPLRLEVGPLSDETATQFARTLLSTDHEDHSQVRAVVGEGRGVPFLIREFAEYLQRSRSLENGTPAERDMASVEQMLLNRI